jgi:4-amino-4-deoxy-L-arabinose transferase-like glycosyltransferase
MRRRLFTALSILSLVVCAGVIGLWAVSQSTTIFLHHHWEFHEVTFSAFPGLMQLTWATTPVPIMDEGLVFTREPGNWPNIGFDYFAQDNDWVSARAIVLPYWLPVLLGAMIPGWTLVQYARRLRRVGDGCCPSCGYNLTGNTSGVCPECGWSTSTPA